jgi:hypothetical protein
MGIDASPRHLRQQSADGLFAEALAGFGGGIEEGQLHAIPPAPATQPGVDAEQQFEHRAAAHGGGLGRVAAEAHGDAAAGHFLQPIADRFGRRHAFAKGEGVLDAGQLLDEAAAGGNDQCVVGHLALVGDDGTAAVFQAGYAAGDEFDGMVLDEAVQRKDQVLALADAGGHPDQAGKIDEFRLGGDQRDAGVGAAAAQLAHGGEGGEAGAEDDYAGRGHGLLESRMRLGNQATLTGILPIFACHSFGPVMCTEVPSESTATVTGMSFTSNS